MMKQLGNVKYGITGAVLLMLLLLCGYAGKRNEPMKTASVSVNRVPYELEALEIKTKERSDNSLMTEREQELELLKNVAEHEATDDTLRRDAISKIAEITERIEVEAAVGACLKEMGIKDVTPVMSAQGITLIMPENSLSDDKMRVQIIDAVTGVSGHKAADIKIILAKK